MDVDIDISGCDESEFSIADASIGSMEIRAGGLRLVMSDEQFELLKIEIQDWM